MIRSYLIKVIIKTRVWPRDRVEYTHLMLWSLDR